MPGEILKKELSREFVQGEGRAPGAELGWKPWVCPAPFVLVQGSLAASGCQFVFLLTLIWAMGQEPPPRY